MFAKRNEEYKGDKAIIAAIDKLLILHADHEQNCSTSTVRIVGSAHAGLFCLLYTSPSPRDKRQSRMPSSA